MGQNKKHVMQNKKIIRKINMRFKTIFVCILLVIYLIKICEVHYGKICVTKEGTIYMPTVIINIM